MFYEQLKKACKNKSTSVTAVLKKIGIGTANGTYWKNGSIPASDTVVQLAEFLEVTTDYLLIGKETTTLTTDEQKLLENYRQLSPGDKEEASKRVKELTTQNISKEREEKHIISQSNISKTNGYEKELLRCFRELPLEEQMRLIGKVETLAEIFKNEESIG
ncbi:MAG: hypothetical protein K2F73_03300 [Ruminococcus sp.]|nr:hypothetical protein [Ruminococcus sp.]